MDRKSAAVRKDEIVKAALALIARNGPGALTTGAIARAVGVSQAAVFRHFPNKSAIVFACVDWIGEQVRPALLAAAADPGTAEQRLRRVIQTMLIVSRRIPAMPTTMFSRELHAEFPELKEMLRERRRGLHATIQALLEEGKAGGAFAPGLDCASAAYLLMGTVHSLLFRRHHIDHDLDVDHQAAVMLDMLFDGLKRR
jgi:TetR/AcrR family transcriptional regulator